MYILFLGDAVAPGAVSDGLAAWFDASEPQALFESTACDNPLEGGSEEVVGCWKGKGPNAYTVQDTSSTYRPAYRPGMINGYNALHFDGINDALQTPNGENTTILSSDSDGTMFAVGSNDTYDSTRDKLAGFGNDTDDVSFGTVNATAQFYENNSTPTDFTHTQSLVVSQPYLFDTRWTIGTDTTVTLGVDGVEETDSTIDITSISDDFAI